MDIADGSEYKTSLQKFPLLSEAEIQGIFSQLKPIWDIFLRVSISSAAPSTQAGSHLAPKYRVLKICTQLSTELFLFRSGVARVYRITDLQNAIINFCIK
jgi:hypothetical protein